LGAIKVCEGILIVGNERYNTTKPAIIEPNSYYAAIVEFERYLAESMVLQKELPRYVGKNNN
jgi:hypothetical protein